MVNTIIHETDIWSLSEDRFGFVTLKHLPTGRTAFFQGDDAALWSRNMDCLLAIKKWNAGNSLDQSFKFLCDGYADLLQPE